MHAVLEQVVCQIGSEVRGLDAETTQLHPKGLHLQVERPAGGGAPGARLSPDHQRSRDPAEQRRVSRNQKRTYLQWSLQLMILSFGALPRGVPALDETMPVAGSFAAMDGRQLGDLLRQEMEAMDTLLDSCRRKFGMERVAVHPWLGPLRVDQWRRFHVVHGLHHLTQLRSVVAQVAPTPVPVR